MSLLESTDPETSTVIKKLLGLVQNNKYKIKKIIDCNPKTHYYIINKKNILRKRIYKNLLKT